ncbi:MAG: hypothetical protein HXX18_07040 [Bacteroidetes bacterium]|nr:hypothetical protein [Bacteroidota bacterium]
MKQKLILLLLFLLFINSITYSQIKTDSNFVFPTLRLAASAMHNSKTKLLSFVLRDEVQIAFQKIVNPRCIIRSNIKQELAFINFNDSITRKDFDRFFWETTITTNQIGRSVFSITFDGPLLNTYRYKMKKDSLIKEKIGKFFSPSIISVGYGYERKLFKNSRFKICYFAFDGKLKLKEKEFTDDHNYLFMGKEQYFKVDYSMNMLLDIKEKLAKNLYIKSLFTINACGLSQKSITFKLCNEFCVEATSFLDIIISTKIDYNPVISYEQFVYNEICLTYHIGKKFGF